MGVRRLYNNQRQFIGDDIGLNLGSNIVYGKVTAAAPNANGNVFILHGLGVVPGFCDVLITGDNDYVAKVQAVDDVNIVVLIKDSAGADVTTGSYLIYWQAVPTTTVNVTTGEAQPNPTQGGGAQPTFDDSVVHLSLPWDFIADATVNSANNNNMVADAAGLFPVTGGKANNFSTPATTGGNGIIRTVSAAEFTTATGEANIPGADPSRVGLINCLSGTAAAQTDFYTHQGDGVADVVPGDFWYQEWMYINYYGSELSQFTSRIGKWLYPSSDGYASDTQKWMLQLTQQNLSTDTIRNVTDGAYFVLRDAEALVSQPRWNNSPNAGSAKLSHNLQPDFYMTYNKWWLCRVRLKTDHISNDNRFEVWLREYGTPTWTKVAEYVSSDTPANRLPDDSFSWSIIPSQVGGHLYMRSPTTFPANNAVGYDSWIYVKDREFANDVNLLQVYTDY